MLSSLSTKSSHAPAGPKTTRLKSNLEASLYQPDLLGWKYSLEYNVLTFPSNSNEASNQRRLLQEVVSKCAQDVLDFESGPCRIYSNNIANSVEEFTRRPQL